jgi:hypothetical protein
MRPLTRCTAATGAASPFQSDQWPLCAAPLDCRLDQHPEQTYSEVRHEADTYQRFDNNVAQGEAPGLVERTALQCRWTASMSLAVLYRL